MVDSKSMLDSVTRLPIIGDLIISFGIVVVLTTLSSAGGYFGLEGKDKELLINIYTYIGIVYFIAAIIFRIYKFMTKKRYK